MEKNRGNDPGFPRGALGSVLPDVASGVVVTGRVISRVAQVLEMSVVSTQGIGGSRTLGDGGVGFAVVVVVFRSLSHGTTGEEEAGGRSGQDKKSHDHSFFCFWK
jgi:hypothetical protein